MVAGEPVLIDPPDTIADGLRAAVREDPDVIFVGELRDKETVLAAARADANVLRHIEGKTLRREIYVPGKIVNIVVG